MGFIQSSINQILGIAAAGVKAKKLEEAKMSKEPKMDVKGGGAVQEPLAPTYTPVNFNDSEKINLSIDHAKTNYTARQEQRKSFKKLKEGMKGGNK